MKIDGREIAGEILERLKAVPRPEKFLAAVLVGENPASVSFLKQKEKVAGELGVDIRLYRFPADIIKEDLRNEVERIAADVACGGIIVQLPLPDRATEPYVLDVIPAVKDVDVLGAPARAVFEAGQGPALPPAVGVVKEILEREGVRLANSVVAVVGAGKLVGQPVAAWFFEKAKEVLVFDEGDDSTALNRADVVVTGVGKGGLIKPAMLKEGVGVIDFGYDGSTGRPIGDLDTSSVPESVAFYTPTPGGTGPILVAKLFENFYTLNRRDSV